MITVDTPTVSCPRCRVLIDRATSEGGWTPQPNDITVCLYCAAVLTFTDTLQLRALSAAALDALEPGFKAELWRYRAYVIARLRRN
jgi:hypothetical protein